MWGTRPRTHGRRACIFSQRRPALNAFFFDGRPVICPPLGRKRNDVYAYAKSDLAAGTVIEHAIGGDEIYGMVNDTKLAEADRNVPVYWFEALEGRHAVLKRALKKDEPVRWDDVDIPDTKYLRLLQAQEELIRQQPEPG